MFLTNSKRSKHVQWATLNSISWTDKLEVHLSKAEQIHYLMARRIHGLFFHYFHWCLTLYSRIFHYYHSSQQYGDHPPVAAGLIHGWCCWKVIELCQQGHLPIFIDFNFNPHPDDVTWQLMAWGTVFHTVAMATSLAASIRPKPKALETEMKELRMSSNGPVKTEVVEPCFWQR